MVATVQFIETNENDLDSGIITNLNLGSANARELNPSLFPIIAGTNSFEKWFKGRFNGTFTEINNIKFFLSSGALLGGEIIKFSGEQAGFQIPVDVLSTVATVDLPTASPASNNVSVGGDLDGDILVAGGETDFMVMQKQISGDALTGLTNILTFTLEYDEVP